MASEATISLAKAVIRLPFIGEECKLQMNGEKIVQSSRHCCVRKLALTISCAAVDVEALSSAAKAVVQTTGKEVVTFEEFQKVFVGEC